VSGRGLIGKQIAMPWFGAAVAAYEQVVPVICSDQADVFALRLGTFAHSPGYGEFDLMRRANTSIAIFHLKVTTQGARKLD